MRAIADRLPFGKEAAPGSELRRQALAAALLFVTLVATGLGWAVSSPLESSPDDDYHLASIWCPRPVEESCETAVVEGKPSVLVPRAIDDQQMWCYVFKPSAPATCAMNIPDDDMAWSPRWDDGSYPKGYYRFHHLLIGSDVQTSVLIMRGTNVLIAAALISLVALAAPERYRRAIIGTIVASWFPMGLYLVASNNPSSWAISGLFIYATALLSSFQSAGWRRILLLVVAALGAAMCLCARYDVSLYLAVVGAALVVTVPSWRGRVPEALMIVAISALGARAALSTAASSGITDITSNPPAPTTPRHRFLMGLETAPRYLGGFWGYDWNPGWGDIPLLIRSPYVLSIMVAGAFILVALRHGTWRKWVAILLLVGTMACLPAYFHSSGIFPELKSYQARYVLPLLAPTVFLGLALDSREESWFTRPQAVWLSVFTWFSLVISHHTMLLRYVHGATDDWPFNLDAVISWWWNAGPSPMTVLGLTSLVTAVGLALAAWDLTVQDRQSAPSPASGAPEVTTTPSEAESSPL